MPDSVCFGVRMEAAQHQKLKQLAKRNYNTVNALIAIAVDQLIEEAKQRGHLPIRTNATKPRARTGESVAKGVARRRVVE